jgi:biopolymer transport protein ExbD
MKLNRRARCPAENSSALSDLAFLLIVYFIVIAGFNANKGFLMNLPAKDSARTVLKDDLLRFELDAAGTLLFQGAAMNTAQAKNTIKAAVAGNPNIVVALSVDPKTPWQQVVSFVELAQGLAVDSFSFSMTKQ